MGLRVVETYECSLLVNFGQNAQLALYLKPFQPIFWLKQKCIYHYFKLTFSYEFSNSYEAFRFSENT